jgi:hypothetical protein
MPEDGLRVTTPSALYLHYFVPDGEVNEIGERMEFELLHYVCAMNVDGLRTDTEFGSRLLGAFTLCEQLQHLPLECSQYLPS